MHMICSISIHVIRSPSLNFRFIIGYLPFILTPTQIEQLRQSQNDYWPELMGVFHDWTACLLWRDYSDRISDSEIVTVGPSIKLEIMIGGSQSLHSIWYIEWVYRFKTEFASHVWSSQRITRPATCPTVRRTEKIELDGTWMGHSIWRDVISCQHRIKIQNSFKPDDGNVSAI